MAVIDMVLGSSDEPIPAEERDYVRAVRAAPTGRAEARGVCRGRCGCADPADRPAAGGPATGGREPTPGCARPGPWLMRAPGGEHDAARRGPAGTGDLRADLTDREVADIVWSTNGPEYWLQLQSRGWSAKRYAELLEDLWCRLLLTAAGDARSAGDGGVAERVVDGEAGEGGRGGEGVRAPAASWTVHLAPASWPWKVCLTSVGSVPRKLVSWPIRTGRPSWRPPPPRPTPAAIVPSGPSARLR